MGSCRPTAFLLAAVLAAGCNPPTAREADGGASDGGVAAEVTALYDTSSDRSDFFALPWPSDARMVSGEGTNVRTFDFRGFHRRAGVVGQMVDLLASEPLGGFGTSSAIYFRFDGPVDVASLPATAAASIADGASAFVVDVTPGSPTAGKRAPVRIGFRDAGGDYLGPNALVLLPAPGYPLRPSTTYAAIVTDGVRARGSGHPVRRAPHFVPPMFPVDPGVDPARIVSATVFTTMDPVSGMRALREAVQASAPKAAIDPGSLAFSRTDVAGDFDFYVGTYAAPIFQQGTPPYLTTGGRIAFAGGKPRVDHVEHLRFALTVPRGDLPPGGWPIVLYAHGTGGDYQSFVRDGSAAQASKVTDDNGAVIARMAMISIDQPNHGPRDPSNSNPEITTYNLQNLPGSRDLFRQSATDDVQLLRVVKSIDVASAPGTGRPLRFDPERVYFKGHSQGGTTGPLFLAVEPQVKAAVLSGAGANLIESLLHKSEPQDIGPIVEAVVGEPVDELHPVMTLVQTFLEPADPGNYARLFFREPPEGAAPKSIFESLGLIDHYAPVPTLFALALATGLQTATPQLASPTDFGLEAVGAPMVVAPPISANVAGGKATGVLCQYRVPEIGGRPTYDGHFVIFKEQAAIRQSNRFLARHAQRGVAILEP